MINKITDVDGAAPGLLARAAEAHAGHRHARHVGSRSRSQARAIRDILRDRGVARCHEVATFPRGGVTVAVADCDDVVIAKTVVTAHPDITESVWELSSLLESPVRTELGAGSVITSSTQLTHDTVFVTISQQSRRVTRDYID